MMRLSAWRLRWRHCVHGGENEMCVDLLSSRLIRTRFNRNLWLDSRSSQVSQSRQTILWRILSPPISSRLCVSLGVIFLSFFMLDSSSPVWQRYHITVYRGLNVTEIISGALWNGIGGTKHIRNAPTLYIMVYRQILAVIGHMSICGTFHSVDSTFK